MSNTLYPREPRPQVAIPDSPPHTPNTSTDPNAFKEYNRSSDNHFGHRQPTSVQTPEASPLIGCHSHNLTGYPLPSNPNLSSSQGSKDGTVGLGLGFDIPMRGSNVDAEKASPERKPRRPLYASLARPGHSHTHSSSSAFHQKHKATTTTTAAAVVAYVSRVPRRLRPMLLLAMSLGLFFMVYISRPAAPSIDSHLAANPDLGAFGNGFIKKQESKLKAIDINEQEPEEHTHNQHRYSAAPKVEFEWETPQDELLALIGFITGATGSVLPPSVDPKEPIDPSVLLGFDPSGQHAHEDLEYLKEEINAQYPLVLFGRLRDRKHAEVDRLLSKWTITPTPLVVDVDMRSDEDLFIPVLERLLGTDELPQLVMLGRSIGGADDILSMDTDELKALLEASEAITVRKGRKAAKHAVNAEKERNERILKPQLKL